MSLMVGCERPLRSIITDTALTASQLISRRKFEISLLLAERKTIFHFSSKSFISCLRVYTQNDNQLKGTHSESEHENRNIFSSQKQPKH